MGGRGVRGGKDIVKHYYRLISQTTPSPFAQRNRARRVAAARVFAPRCKPAPSACKTYRHHPSGPLLTIRKGCDDDKKNSLLFPLKTLLSTISTRIAHSCQAPQHPKVAAVPHRVQPHNEQQGGVFLGGEDLEEDDGLPALGPLKGLGSSAPSPPSWSQQNSPLAP